MHGFFLQVGWFRRPEEHDVGGLAARVCLGQHGAEVHNSIGKPSRDRGLGERAIGEHGVGGQVVQAWSRATCNRGARRRRAGRTGVVSGNTQPRSTAQAS